MSNKFLCGRLLIQNDGSVKKLSLADGGGARDCFISHIDMGFDEIHDRLREIFGFHQTNHQTKLYDFRCKELNPNEYTTFYDYVQKHGLRFKGILLYLCTSIDVEDTITIRTPEKRKTTNPCSIIRIPQMEADSSTSLPTIKSDIDNKSINESSINNHSIEIHHEISYSFDKSLNELMNYLRDLIHRYKHENILIQLFEHICILYGISSIILDRLKQQPDLFKQSNHKIYFDGLDKIEKISRIINASIELNQMNISHMDTHSIIKKMFNEFQKHFNILRENYYLSTTTSSTIDYHSKINSRKRTHSSNSYRKHNDDNEKYSLFKYLLRSLESLSDELYQRRFMSFYYMIKKFIDEIKIYRLNFKLNDHRLLKDIEQYLFHIEKCLTNRINDEHRRIAPHKLNFQLEYNFDKTLDSIRDLHEKLSRYQIHKRSSLIENKSIKNNNDDDESSDASHSSVGDDVLMEVARNSFEQR